MSDEDGDRRPFETESDSPRSSASDARSTLSVMDYLDGEEELYDHREHHDADDEMSDSDYHCSLNLNDIPMQDVSEVGIGAKEYIDRAPQVTTAEVEMKPHGFDSVVQGAKDKFTENVEDAGQIKAENTLPDRTVKGTPNASFCDGGRSVTRPIPKITPAMLEKLRRPEPGAANAASQDETRSVFTSIPPVALTEMQKKLRSHDADSFHDVGCSRNAVAPEAETMDNKSEWLTGRIKQEHFDPSPFGRGLSAGKLGIKLHQMENEPNLHAVAFDAVNRAEEPPSNYPLPQFTTTEIEKKPDGFDKFANGSQEKVKENFGDTGLNGIPNTSPDRTVGGTSEAPFHDGGRSVRKPFPKITPAMLEKIHRPEPVASPDASTPNVKDSLDAFSCGKSRSVSSSAPITPLTEMQKKLRSHSLVAPLDPGRFRDALRMSPKKKLEKRTGPEAPSDTGLDAGGQPGNNPIHQVATARIQKKPHGFDYVGEGAKVKIKNSVGQNEIGNTPADWPMEGTPDASFHDGGRSAHRPIPKITPEMLEKLRKPDPAASRDVGCFKMKNEPSVHAVGEYSHEDDAEEQFSHKKASAGDVFLARYLANKRRMRKAAENSIHDDDGPSLPKRSRKKNKPSMEGIKIGSERACGEERFPRPIDEALEEILIEKGEDLEEMEAEGTLSALKNLKLSEEGDSDAVIPDEDVAVADLIPQIKRKVTISQSSSSSDEDEGASSNDTDEDWRRGQRKTRKRKRNIALHEEEQAGCSVPPKIHRTATEATMAQIHWMYGVVTEYSPSGPGKEGDDFFAQVFGIFRDMGMVRDDNLRATYQAAQTRAIEVTKTYFPQWIPRHQRNAQSADETHDEEDQEEDGEDVAVVAGPEMVDEGIHEDSEESGIQEEEEQVDQDLPFDGAFPYEDEAYNSDISSTGIYEEMEQEPLVMPVVDPDQEMAPPDEEHSDMSTAASPVKPMNAVALPKQPKMAVEMIQQIFCKCAFRYFKHLKEKYVKEVRAAQRQSEIHHWKQEFDAIMKGEGGASE